MPYIFVFYLLLAFATRWLALPYLGERYLGGSSLDAGLYIYLSKAAFPSLLLNDWFSLKTFYPYSYALAWSDNFVLPSIIFHFLIKFLGEAFSYNLLFIGAQTLNGYLSFLLARRLNCNLVYSFLFGTFLTSYAYFTTQLGHPQVQFFFFIPAALLLYIKFLQTNSAKTAIFLGLIVFLSFLTTVYYAVFIGMIVSLFSLGWLIQKTNARRFIQLIKLCIFSLIGALPTLPFILPYLKVQEAFGSRFQYEAAAFAITPSAILNPSSLSAIYGSFASADGESQFFPGVVIIFLVCLCAWHIFKTSFIAKIWTFSTIFFLLTETYSNSTLVSASLQIGLRWLLILTSIFLLFSKQVVKKTHRETSKTKVLNNCTQIFPLLIVLLLMLSFGPVAAIGYELDPFNILFNYLPGTSALRAVSRYLLVAIFLALLFTCKILSEQKVLKETYVLAACALLIIENFCSALAIEAPVAKPALAETIVNFADSRANQNNEVVGIMLPLATKIKPNGEVQSWREYADRNVRALIFSNDLNARLINGYSGQRSKIIKEFPGKLKNFPDDKSIKTLSTIAGLKFIHFDANALPDFNIEDFKAKVKKQSRYIRPLAVKDREFLFEWFGVTKITAEYELLAAASPNLDLKLKLKPKCSSNETYKMKSFKKRIKISDLNHRTSLRIPLRKGTHEFNLHFPRTNNKLYTRKLIFTFPKDCDLWLLDSSVTKK